MNSAREIVVSNLHEHIIYNIFPEKERCILNWDTRNNDLNTLMKNENSLLLNQEYYSNALWINEIKRVLGWGIGKSYDIVICYIPSQIVVYKTVNILNSFVKIDENGYLLVRQPFKQLHLTYERCNCLYNDLLDEENLPYTLK
jgi:hypothetical protein